MLVLLGLLSLVVGIASLICFIMVLIKLFQVEGALKGILGIICSIYTFIWGWINVDNLGIRQIMTIWSALIVVGLLLNVGLRVAAPAATPIGVPGATTLPAGGGVR